MKTMVDFSAESLIIALQQPVYTADEKDIFLVSCVVMETVLHRYKQLQAVYSLTRREGIVSTFSQALALRSTDTATCTGANFREEARVAICSKPIMVKQKYG